MAKTSKEDSPAIAALKKALTQLERDKDWQLKRRGAARAELDGANESLVLIASQQDSIEASLKYLVKRADRKIVSEREAVDRLGGVL